MILARVAQNPKLLVLYDIPQSDVWIKEGKVTKDGIEPGNLLKDFIKHEIDLEGVSMCCLSDNPDGKANGYKEKSSYITELIETLSPNLILLPNSKVFEKFIGMKGVSKFYNKIVIDEKYNKKTLTIPPYSVLNYNPNMYKVITEGMQIIKQEMTTSEITKQEIVEKKYYLIDSLSKFESLYGYYRDNVFRFSLDIETDSLQFNHPDSHILTIQVAHKAHTGYCIQTPEFGGKWTKEEWAYIISCLKELIEDGRRCKVGANIYFDLKFLNHHYGIKLVRHNVYDVLIASFLCREDRESHSLKYCASTLLTDPSALNYDAPLEIWKDKFCKETGTKKADFKYSLVPIELLFPYSCMDVDFSLQLADYFDEELKKEEQVEVFKYVSSYAWALAKIEQAGWKIDLEEARRYEKELEERIEILTLQIKELPEVKKAVQILSKIKLEKENEKRVTKLTELKKPLEFLFSSVQHKRVLFRDVLKLKEVKQTKKGEYATDKECYETWQQLNPELECLNLIQKQSELQKMLNTYVRALLNKNVNGRIHCSFKVTGCATGRVSSFNPNLQNVSQHSEEAVKLKKCFIAEKGHKLVISDLSNAELRITAAVTKDPAMTSGFVNGLDPHSNTAKEVFSLDCEVHEVKEKYNDFRQLAKTLGFAALYGASKGLIAKKAKISEDEAEQMLSDYFEKHKGIKEWMAENLKFAREHEYVVAPSGRKRRVPYINSEDRGLRARAERQSNNFVIQSLASDGALQSIVNMWEEIEEKGLPYKIINVIHDSCEMEVPEENVEEACAFIKRHLSRWPDGVTACFGMKADVETGYAWSDVEKVKEINDFEELLEDLDLEQDIEEDN